MTAWLKPQGDAVNPTRVARRLRVLGVEAISPKLRPSRSTPGHRSYPYLLRGRSMRRVHHVWSTDSTSIRLRSGCIYVVAGLEWFSRSVVSWAVSTPLDGGCCVEAVERALEIGQPEILPSAQGAQVTSRDVTSRLEAAGIQSSMAGRGRALDHICVERLWRSVKDEEVYLNDDETPTVAVIGLRPYFDCYNAQRLHQALDDHTPAAVYGGGQQRALGFHQPGKPPTV
jgi:putative transposase